MTEDDKIKIAGILERIEAAQSALYKDVVELGTVDVGGLLKWPHFWAKIWPPKSLILFIVSEVLAF